MNLNNITTALKTGITIYQYEQWQNTGSVNLMQKESHMLSKVWLKTNIHNPNSEVKVAESWIKGLSNSLLLLLQNSIFKNTTNG